MEEKEVEQEKGHFNDKLMGFLHQVSRSFALAPVDFRLMNIM